MFEPLFEHHFYSDPLDRPPNFTPKIKIILETHVSLPSKSPIAFDFTKDAMLHDSKILQSFDCDIEEIIRAHPNSDNSYGSDFRPNSIMEPLLHKHKDWVKIKGCLLNGFDADFRATNDQRLLDVQAAISRSNHESAIAHHDVLL